MIFMSKLMAVGIIFVISVIDFSNSYMRPKYKRRNHIDKEHDKSKLRTLRRSKDQCWMKLNPKKHFDVMDKLDENYAEIRNEYQKAVEKDNFDGQMLEMMLKTRGVAEREIHKVDGHSGLIPAGINLGGYCMMRMPNSVLFFHRVKLRNNTHFRVRYLHNDLTNMVLNASIALNDLHLLGSYDRSVTDSDPMTLYYTPTYGQVEFLFRNVQYNMEGRYRLLEDRLTIELIVSEISYDDVMMSYLNNVRDSPKQLQRKSIEDFLARLKKDLDKWLKDYFNDYLMYFGIVGQKNDKFQQYNKERVLQLNEYADLVIDVVVQKIHEAKAASVTLPKFKIFTQNAMELVLKNGVLRGLDSMYRRSVATGKKEKGVRTLDAVIGFSNLKVTYQYEARLGLTAPPLKGLMIFTADEIIARMGVTMAMNSETVDMQFEFMEQAKPQSLTIEGAANKIISNFKYIIEQHVIAIMSNTILHNIKSLGSIARCVPLLHGPERTEQFNRDNLSSGQAGLKLTNSAIEKIPSNNEEIDENVNKNEGTETQKWSSIYELKGVFDTTSEDNSDSSLF